MGKSFDDLVEVKPPEGNNLLVVDGLNLAFRWKHSSGEVDAASYLDTIESLAKSYEAGTIVVLTDYKRSIYRTNLYPDYKGNRREKYQEQTAEEEEAFLRFINSYEEALSLCGEFHTVVKIEGVEADDIAACICDKYIDGYDHVWLISSDKDWDLLIEDKVSRFSYVTRKETTVDSWEFMYEGIPMDKYIDFKVLEGDKGDNVPGVALIGPVRAKSLLNDYGCVLDLIDQLPLPGNAKYIQNLNASVDQLYLNFELMDLRSYCWDALAGNSGLLDELMQSCNSSA